MTDKCPAVQSPRCPWLWRSFRVMNMSVWACPSCYCEGILSVVDPSYFEVTCWSRDRADDVVTIDIFWYLAEVVTRKP